jgi:hypothetical protein
LATGALDKRYSSAAVNSLRHLGTFPGVRSFWESRKFYYAEEFKAFLDREIFVQDADADYHLAGTSFTREPPDTGT